MSKRKVVKLNLEFVKKKIKEKCRSNVVFCELMGRSKQKTWVTGWGIEKNLPSPEEAARMCAILQVTPEEILVEQADIELVQSLIDQQREEQKEKPAQKGELDEVTKKLFQIIDESTDAERQEMLDYIEFMKTRRKKGGEANGK